MKKILAAILAIALVVLALQFVACAAPNAVNISEIIVAVNGDTSGKLTSGAVVSSVTVSNNTASGQDATLVSALYLNSTLVALETDYKPFAAAASDTLTTTHTLLGNAQGYELRNMVWDNVVSMKPYVAKVVNNSHGRVIPGVQVKAVHDSAPIGDITPAITRVMLKINSTTMNVSKNNNVSGTNSTVAMPYKNDGVVRVSHEALVPFGAVVDWNNSSGDLTVTKDGVVTTLKRGSTDMYVDGEKTTIAYQVESSESKAMIPIETAAQITGAEAAEYADGRVSLVLRQASAPYGIDYVKLNECKDLILTKLARNGARFNEELKDADFPYNDMFPEATNDEGLFKTRDWPGWIAGFYTGLNYICYNWSEDQQYINNAKKVFDTLEHFLYNKPTQYYHDLGFTFMLSSYEDYLVTGDQHAKDVVIKAADVLKARVNEPVGYIAGWDPWDPTDLSDKFGQSNRYRLIVDTMCNVPILFTATELTGNSVYEDVATRHIRLTQQYLVRPDFTTPHTYAFDAAGNPKGQKTHQGASDTSCWARGQSWVINGMAHAYLKTGDESFLQTSKDCADTYFMMTDTDLISRWDLIYTNNKSEPKDTSAAAITACGFMDIWEATGDEFYKDNAYKIWSVLYDYYSTKDDSDHEGIIHEAVGNKPGNSNITVSIIYGDYYFAQLTQRFLDLQ